MPRRIIRVLRRHSNTTVEICRTQCDIHDDSNDAFVRSREMFNYRQENYPGTEFQVEHHFSVKPITSFSNCIKQ